MTDDGIIHIVGTIPERPRTITVEAAPPGFPDCIAVSLYGVRHVIALDDAKELREKLTIAIGSMSR